MHAVAIVVFRKKPSMRRTCLFVWSECGNCMDRRSILASDQLHGVAVRQLKEKKFIVWRGPHAREPSLRRRPLNMLNSEHLRKTIAQNPCDKRDQTKFCSASKSERKPRTDNNVVLTETFRLANANNGQPSQRLGPKSCVGDGRAM